MGPCVRISGVGAGVWDICGVGVGTLGGSAGFGDKGTGTLGGGVGVDACDGRTLGDNAAGGTVGGQHWSCVVDGDMAWAHWCRWRRRSTLADRRGMLGAGMVDGADGVPMQQGILV